MDLSVFGNTSSESAPPWHHLSLWSLRILLLCRPSEIHTVSDTGWTLEKSKLSQRAPNKYLCRFLFTHSASIGRAGRETWKARYQTIPTKTTIADVSLTWLSPSALWNSDLSDTHLLSFRENGNVCTRRTVAFSESRPAKRQQLKAPSVSRVPCHRLMKSLILLSLLRDFLCVTHGQFLVWCP